MAPPHEETATHVPPLQLPVVPVNPIEAFRAELHASETTPDAKVLLPDRLARACVAALPFDAAGLSRTLQPHRRRPLGASEQMAATAERLQFAAGDGPCTAAHRANAPVLALEKDLTAQWPMYAAQLATHTPYRMALSLPVGGPLRGAVVIDLYRTRPDPPGLSVLEAVTEVAHACGDHLAAAMGGDADLILGLPPTLHTPAITARHAIWQAIGHTTVQLHLSSPDALAVLRGLAFRHDTDLETIADQILRGDLDIPTDAAG